METTSVTSNHEEQSGKLLILAAVCMSALVLPISFTGGAVATPAIGRELQGSPVSLTWITNAFMLSFGSLLMAAGALADLYGRKRLFAIGMALYTLVSLAISFAPSVVWLDALRALQGVAAAASLASGSAALAQEFEGHARARAFSMLGTTFGIGLAFGPLIAGALIEGFGWRSIFVFTAIIGALSLAFGIPRMRETRDPDAKGIDWPGTLTFSSSLALFTFAIIQAPQSGWGSFLVISLLTASVALLMIFVTVETLSKRPMLDLTLFRFPRFIGVQILPIGTCFCYIVLVVMLPLRFIGAEGLSEIHAGLLMLYLSAPMLVVPMFAATLTRWISAATLCSVGFLIAAGGLYWLSLYHFGDAKATLILPMLLIGIGAGMPWGLMDGLAVNVVPKERAGMATGIFNTARVAGEGIILAAASTILASFVQSRLFAASHPDSAEARIAQASQSITAGDMTHALAMLPEFGSAVLAQNYSEAFTDLLHVLIAITVTSAVVVFFFLGKNRRA